MKAIIVVDCQNDFSDYGALPVIGANELANKINIFLNSIDLRQFKIAFSKDWHPETHISFQQWPKHCVRNTSGADYIHPLELFHPKNLELKKGTNCSVDSYSAFYENENKSELHKFLQDNKIQDIYVCGLVKDICVLKTLNDGVAMGYKTYLLEDLSLALNEDLYQKSVSKSVTSINSKKIIK